MQRFIRLWIFPVIALGVLVLSGTFSMGEVPESAKEMPAATTDALPTAIGGKSVDAPTGRAEKAPLPVFGRDLFNSPKTTFEPNPDTPVPANYVLGAGDTLSVICWYGSKEYERSSVEITPDGTIFLKLLGKVPLAEKTLAQATDDLHRRYAALYEKFSLTVDVVGRRTMPIFVMGEVNKPGKYLLSSLSTVFTALYAAGGPTDLGSLRNIRIMRDQKAVAAIDLYEYLLNGKFVDIPLKSGDTVYMPLAKKVVTIEGQVRRPAQYELLDTDSLGDAILLAGGATATSANRVNLSRVGDDRQRQVLDLSLPADSGFELKDGDDIVLGAVLPYLRNAATVEGAVNRPGSYPLEKATTVAALVALAEGVTPNAYMPQAQLYRYNLTGQSQMVSIDLAKALADDPKENITLRPLDRLVVGMREKVNDLFVAVEGEVVGPGTFPYYDGMKVSDAVLLAGGLKPDVMMDRALLIRRNPKDYAEEVTEISLRGVLAHNQAADIALRNRDRLVVYPKSQLGDEQFVTIEGEIFAPGQYPYIGGMRVNQLLLLAKGVKKEAYTPRAELYRLLPDHTRQMIPVDLVKAAGGAATDDNPLLQPADRLVVSRIEEKMERPVVKVDGYVRKPGTYPHTVGMKLSDLLSLAGGLKLEAARTVDLYRQQGTAVKASTYALQEVDGRLIPDVDPILDPNDLVSVRENASYAKVTDTVSIEGEVQSPGAFPAYEGTRQTPKTLYKVLTQAGGFMPEAYPAGVVLYRQQSAVYTAGQQWELAKTTRSLDSTSGVEPPKDLTHAVPAPNAAALKEDGAQTATSTAGGTPVAPVNPKAPFTEDQAASENLARIENSLAKVIATGKDDSVALVIPPRSLETQQFSLSLPVDAERILRSKGKEGDLALEPGDVIYVPKRPTTVTILGGVITNGSVIFRDGKSATYYINSVGGIALDGDAKRTVIMHVNGQIALASKVKAIQPGDIILVPTKHIVQSIHTSSGAERLLGTLAQLALSALPFIK